MQVIFLPASLLCEAPSATNSVGQKLLEDSLFDAIKENNIEEIEILLKKGINVNTKSDELWTPLHLATELGFKNIIEFLIKNGANVNVYAKDNISPIILAIEQGSKDIVEILIENGANVNATTKFYNEKLNETYEEPILLSTLRWRFRDIAKMLIENGANVNIITKYGETPLMMSIIMQDEELINLTINNSTQINTKTRLRLKNKNEGQENFMKATPLHLAVTCNMLSVAQSLIKNNADVNIYTEPTEEKITDYLCYELSHDVTPLHIAANNGNLKIAQLLINNDANINATNKLDQTPLHLAIRNEQQEMTNFLMQSNADTTIKDIFGKTPLDYLKEPSTSLTDLIFNSVANNNIDVVKNLIKKEINLNIPDVNKNTLLHVAAEKGLSEICILLLKNNASPDLTNNLKLTPLHVAIWKGHKDLARELIKIKKNLTAKN